MCHFQVFGHMPVAWIRLFHCWIRYAYLAVWPSCTSLTDQLKHILETSHVQWIVFQCWKFCFVFQTSSRVRHATVDRFWDDDRLAGHTPRSERLPLTDLFTAYWRRRRCKQPTSALAYWITACNTLQQSVECIILSIHDLNVSNWQYSSSSVNAVAHIIQCQH